MVARKQGKLCDIYIRLPASPPLVQGPACPQVEQLIDGGRAFLADTILFLVFYSPTIDNADVPAWYHIQSAPDPRLPMPRFTLFSFYFLCPNMDFGKRKRKVVYILELQMCSIGR